MSTLDRTQVYTSRGFAEAGLDVRGLANSALVEYCNNANNWGTPTCDLAESGCIHSSLVCTPPMLANVLAVLTLTPCAVDPLSCVCVCPQDVVMTLVDAQATLANDSWSAPGSWIDADMLTVVRDPEIELEAARALVIRRSNSKLRAEIELEATHTAPCLC